MKNIFKAFKFFIIIFLLIISIQETVFANISGFEYDGNTSSIQSRIIQSDGKKVVYGYFNSYKGLPVKKIVRLNSDDTLDNTFNINFDISDSIVRYLYLQRDGKILVKEDAILITPFTNDYYDNSYTKSLIRLNTDGSIDNTFNYSSDQKPYRLLLQSDGKMIILSNRNGKVFRINSDGSVDNSYVIGYTGCNNGLLQYHGDNLSIDSNDRLIASGDFYTCNAKIENLNLRFNTNGSADMNYGSMLTNSEFNPNTSDNNNGFCSIKNFYALGGYGESYDARFLQQDKTNKDLYYLESGAPVTLKWDASNCSSNFKVNGETKYSGVAYYYPNVDTSYTLRATNEDGSGAVTKTINIKPVRACEIKYFISDSQSILSGSSVKLSWATYGCKSVKINNITQSQNTGTLSVSPTVDTIYKFSVIDAMGDRETEYGYPINIKVTNFSNFNNDFTDGNPSIEDIMEPKSGSIFSTDDSIKVTWKTNNVGATAIMAISICGDLNCIEQITDYTTNSGSYLFNLKGRDFDFSRISSARIKINIISRNIYKWSSFFSIQRSDNYIRSSFIPSESENKSTVQAQKENDNLNLKSGQTQKENDNLNLKSGDVNKKIINNTIKPEIEIVLPKGNSTIHISEKLSDNTIYLVWETKNVLQDTSLDNVKLIRYVDGIRFDEYILATNIVNDGSQIISLSKNLPSGDYKLEINSNLGVALLSGVNPDGYININNHLLANQDFTKSQKDMTKVNKVLKYGMTSNDVLILQRYLNSNGYNLSDKGIGSKGMETNFFGAKTRNALKKFQRDNRLTPSGILDLKTKALMK